MKKNKVITILIFAVIIVLAVVFMILGAKQEGKKYSVEKVKDYNYFILQENEKFGVINKEAKVIIEPKFENVVIPNPSKGVFICTTENKETKIYNEKNEEQFSDYEEVSAIRLKNIVTDLMYEKSVLKYFKDGKYGLIDYLGNKITDAEYGQIDSLGYKEGELLVEQNGKFGVINIKGNNLIPVKYDIVEVDEYYNDENYNNAGYIVGIKTEEGYRYGYIDIDGNEILKPEYNELSRIIDIKQDKGLYLLASKNGQFGVYKNGSQIINHEYQSISYNKNNNIFIVEKSKRYGVVGIDGRNLVDIKYTQIDVSGKYLYAKDITGKIEVFDVDGKLTNMSNNIAKLSAADGKYLIVITNEENKTVYGIEDKNGKKLVENKYNYIEYLFDNYFIAANSEGKLGIIDDNGNQKMEFKYSSIQKIKDTDLIQASISSENLTEIYYKDMRKITEMNNAIITLFDDYLKVYNTTKTVYINKDGKEVKNKEVYKNNKLFAVEKDGKWGFEDENGAVKVDCKYDRVTEYNKFGYAGIKKDGKWGVIDNNMKVILEPKYEFKSNEDPDFLGIYYKVSYGFGETIYTNK